MVGVYFFLISAFIKDGEMLFFFSVKDSLTLDACYRNYLTKYKITIVAARFVEMQFILNHSY